MKTIIDAIQEIAPSKVVRSFAGVEVAQHLDFRPRMFKAAAHAALTSAIWEAQADIRRAETARAREERAVSGEEHLLATNEKVEAQRLGTERTSGLNAAIYCALRADMAQIKGLTPFDQPMDVASMYDFLTPKEEGTADEDRLPELLKQLDVAQRRRFHLDARTEVISVIESCDGMECPDRIELPLQFKMADRAVRAVLKDAERYVRNAATKGRKAQAQSMENQLLARRACKELLDQVSSIVRENMDEVKQLMENGYMPPDLELSAYIEEAEAESISAIKEQIARLS